MRRMRLGRERRLRRFAEYPGGGTRRVRGLRPRRCLWRSGRSKAPNETGTLRNRGKAAMVGIPFVHGGEDVKINGVALPPGQPANTKRKQLRMRSNPHVASAAC